MFAQPDEYVSYRHLDLTFCWTNLCEPILALFEKWLADVILPTLMWPHPPC